MKSTSSFALSLVVTFITLGSAQDLRLPREPEKLIDRSQTFWNLLTSNQRLRALEFILPEKREAFLSGGSVPILKAKVLGLDLTSNLEEAFVRIGIEVLSKESSSGFLNWTLTDKWIWKDDNWYLNIEPARDVFPRGSPEPPIDVKKVQEEINKNFKILRDSIDLGTLMQGQHFQIEVPIKYTGDLPLSLELDFPNPLVALGYMSEPITSRTDKFVLLVGTDDWNGPFTLPLPLKIRYQQVTVERTILLKGSVFVPISFRQVPPNGPIEEGREFSVFIRNNTDQKLGVTGVLVDAIFDVPKWPEVLLPHDEGEVILKLRPNRTPGLLTVVLENPVNGRQTYAYRFRNVRP